MADEGSKSQFEEVHDLSLLELITVEELIKLQQPILRFDLYKKINQLVRHFQKFGHEGGKLSTSSFYNTLKKLEAREIVEFRDAKSNVGKKAIEVLATDKAELLLGFSLYYLLQYYSSENTVDVSTIDLLLSQLNTPAVESSLIIDPGAMRSSELITSIIPMTRQMIKSIASVSDNAYLVTPEQFFQNYASDLGIENVELSRMTEGKDRIIREPDSYFDVVLFPMYRENLESSGFSFEHLLSEVKRLLTNEGTLMLLFLNNLTTDDHYIIDALNSILSKSIFFRTYNQDDIEQILQTLGFSVYNNLNTKGITFLMANKNV